MGGLFISDTVTQFLVKTSQTILNHPRCETNGERTIWRSKSKWVDYKEFLREVNVLPQQKKI